MLREERLALTRRVVDLQANRTSGVTLAETLQTLSPTARGEAQLLPPSC